jgi:hypothetical protein
MRQLLRFLAQICVLLGVGSLSPGGMWWPCTPRWGALFALLVAAADWLWGFASAVYCGSGGGGASPDAARAGPPLLLHLVPRSSGVIPVFLLGQQRRHLRASFPSLEVLL